MRNLHQLCYQQQVHRILQVFAEELKEELLQGTRVTKVTETFPVSRSLSTYIGEHRRIGIPTNMPQGRTAYGSHPVWEEATRGRDGRADSAKGKTHSLCLVHMDTIEVGLAPDAPPYPAAGGDGETQKGCLIENSLQFNS
ncbi:hypothetical protein DPX16_6627 [Anabarilius grahami]|uniref:Uncharacterized protein n=1 Tax=Anabarilius grahami TaxID=495550 RepID=A0A3N0Z366_ANAGA|nr:hypothetical protein DPX16_6627 [Anabarilius grahami]